MGVDYLKTLGVELIRLGFQPVPIKPGYKYPKGLKNWQNIEATEADVLRWANNGFKNGGVGVKTGNVVAIDIDVRDKRIVDEMTRYCEDKFGVAPQRVGQEPKTMLVFQTDESFSKMASATYEDFLGDTHRVEILGEGQQFVAYGVHPDTNKPYKWHGGPGLSDIARVDLPKITREQASAIVEHFETIAPDDWELKSPGHSGAERVQSNGASDLMGVSPTVNVNDDQVREALELIEEYADDYETWVNVGMALHHQYDGGADGLELFDDWSQNSVKYKDGEADVKWRSFNNAPRNRSPITFAYVLKLKNDVLKEHQLRRDLEKVEAINPPGDNDAANEQDRRDIDYVDLFLRRYLLVEQGKQVADLTRPPQCCLSKLDEFQAVTANVRIEVPAPTVADPDKTKMVPVANLWLVNPERQNAFAAGYHPDYGRVYTDPANNQTFVNTFHVPEFDEFEAELGSLDVFFEHMEYLIPNETERDWFLGWLAFNIQRPQQRCKVTPLHVSTAHGTGRGWLVELIQKLVGSWNCSKTTMEHLCNEGSAGQYQEFLDKTLVCFIEEVRESSKRYSISTKIRSTLTDLSLPVNIKFGAKQTKPVYTNFFFMSNHVDALVLPEDDRRVQVLFGPKTKRDRAYYDRLYAWSADRFNVAVLYYYLANYELSGFDWQHSTDTAGRARMIDCNLTPTEAAFNEFVRGAGKVAVCLETAIKQIEALMEGDPFDNPVDRRQVLKLLQHNAVHHKQIKINGNPVRPWLVGEWSETDNDEVRKFLHPEDK